MSLDFLEPERELDALSTAARRTSTGSSHDEDYPLPVRTRG
jgi:hypothetical protein